MMMSPGFPKDHIQVDFDHTIDNNVYGWDDGGFDKENGGGL